VAAVTPVVLVCPTSHMDWDWHDTFAEYFSVGPPSNDFPNGTAFGGAVNDILTGVCDLLTVPPPGTGPSFSYSMAEVGYLQAFLAASPERLPVLLRAGPDRFALMGGGITSPDSLLCHGEVFIRNYLVGRRWLESVGLRAHVSPVAWLPDDFGHDPQLPVALAAMGLKWAGISRVPGSVQPFPNQPVNPPGGDSVATRLTKGGLVFPWIADDGSAVLTLFMPDTYGAPWDGSSGAGGLVSYVEGYAAGWPVVDGACLMFAPAGGDFVFSGWDAGGQGSWLTVVNDYNQDTNKKATDPVADIGTFAQFMSRAAGSAGDAQAPLQAQNYWTGIFASRPRLKILHYRAAQRALAAEAATALLRLASTYATAVLDDLDACVDQAWQALVPSSHHDYITGTSPDRVYWSEQLPQLELADRLADQCLTRAVGLIAQAVTLDSVPGGDTQVVVYNSLGFARGGVVCLPARALPGSFGTVNDGTPIQLGADGDLLFQAPAPVASFGYSAVVLEPGVPVSNPLPPPDDVISMNNGTVAVILERSQGWAITSLQIQGVELLPPNGPGNSARLGNSIHVYDDSGNIYQFGNEPLTRNTPGTFADSGTVLAADAGEWIELGPVRWHFRATLTGSHGQTPVSCTLDYLLYAGEPVLWMRVTGTAAPSTTVLTAFDLAAPGSAGYNLTYGTAHHYDDNLPVRYWDDPTFRATHDFVQTTGSVDGPELAIYHQGVPAWGTISSDAKGQLLGALLRNTDGWDRGAAGTDPGVHTLEYAVGGADLSPATGDPLRMALTVSNPLVAAVPPVNRPTAGISLPPQASLATITSPPAGILRLARTRPGGSVVTIPAQPDYYAERKSYILRVYLPASFGAAVEISVPSLPDPGLPGYDPDLAAVAVSALEEPVTDGPDVTVSGSTLSFTSKLALTTVQLTATRCPTQPGNGEP
jgi:alpha-mannosidase